MTEKELLSERLSNQQLGTTKWNKPEEVVAWLGALQAQDFEHSKWAIGIRLPDTTMADIEQALAQRKVIRSWLLRGTLHIVAAQDIHWMLDLLAPRILAANAGRYRQLELDDKLLKKSNALLNKALQREGTLTREALAERLQRSGITTDDQRLVHLLQYAALTKVICFGSRQGSKFTFTLLDPDRPEQSPLSQEESLARLAVRYFQSHGPAGLADFVWWSGLNKTLATTGIRAAGSQLSSDKINDTVFWRCDREHKSPKQAQRIFFLPAFDEFIIGYKDRSFTVDQRQEQAVISKNGIFYPVILEQGKALGIWKRSVKQDEILIRPHYFHDAGIQKEKAIQKAGGDLGRFTGKKVRLIQED
jgi:hypothetical protein